MKHFRYSLERHSNGEMRQLKGDPVANEQTLRDAFKVSHFHYQFQSEGVSRIMRCSTPNELEFVVQQFKAGAWVVIQRA